MTKLFFQCSKIVVIVLVVLILLVRFIGTGRESSGDLLVYTVRNYGDTSLMLLDFSKATNTTIFKSNDGIGFSLSVDGQLAYLPNSPPESDSDYSEIYILDTQLMAQRTVKFKQDPNDLVYLLGWSPDGRYLVYATLSARKSTLYIWDGETLVDVTPVDLYDHTVSYRTAWSNSGKLAFTVSYATSTGLHKEIYLWDGNAITNLSQNPLGEDRDPAWSADEHLAFLSVRDGNYNIYGWDGISYLDGLPNIQPLIDNSLGLVNYNSSPGWTPNGQLTFASETAANPYFQIYVWDGHTATNVSQNPGLHNIGPEWSNDGRWAFTTFFTSDLLYVRDANNNPLLTVQAKSSPAWSPNGLLMFCNYRQQLLIWNGYEIIKIAQANHIAAEWVNGNEIYCSGG